MDFEFTKEQKNLRALVRDFSKREFDWDYFKELWRYSDPRDRIPWALLEKLHALGLMQLAVPQRYGGGGAGWLTQLVVGEELTRYALPLGVMLGGIWKWHSDLAAVGSKELQDEIFPQVMTNPRLLYGDTISEAEAGSDTYLPYDESGDIMQTFAYRDGNEWVINGEKNFCSGAPVADLLYVYARTEKNKPISKSVTMFLVPTNSPGFSITRINDLLSNPLRGNADLFFENVRVPDLYRVSEVNDGYRCFHCRLSGKITQLGPSIGYAQMIYEKTKEYAKTRVQGGKPIFQHLNIGPIVVEMGQLIETARLLAYRGAWEYDKANTPWVDPMWYNLASAHYKKIRLRTCEIIAEVFGSQAVVKDLPIEGYIRGAYGYYHSRSTVGLELIKCMETIEDLVPTGC